jgi:hypothetical protein
LLGLLAALLPVPRLPVAGLAFGRAVQRPAALPASHQRLGRHQPVRCQLVPYYETGKKKEKKKQNKTKQNKTKQNKTKQNKKAKKQNKTKQNKTQKKQEPDRKIKGSKRERRKHMNKGTNKGEQRNKK